MAIATSTRVMCDMELFNPAIIDLGLPENFGIYFEPHYPHLCQLELRLLDYTRVRRMPIGYLAYTSRFSNAPFKKRWIDPDSLRVSRMEPLRVFACSLSEKSAFKLSASGVHENYSMFSEFVSFCDETGCEDVLDSPECYHMALIKYSLKINRDVAETGIGNRPNRKLVVAVDVGAEVFPGVPYNFRVGVQFPGYSKDEQKNTRVPDDEKLFPLYRVADAVFKETLEFLRDPIKQAKAVEKYGERYWFLPTYYPLITETAIVENQKKKSRGLVLTLIRNHALNLIETSEGEITRSEAISTIVGRLVAGETLVNDNATSRVNLVSLLPEFEPEHFHRLAMLAHDCFLFIFILNTSANVSVAANILWDDALSIEVEVQRLRSIKRRAKNMTVDVIFGVRFLKRLRDYFALRAYLPGVETLRYLFGTFDLSGSPLQIGDNPAANLLAKLRRVVNPGLHGVGYRELRVYHHHSKTSEHGLAIAAESAQHSEETALQSYTAGNEEAVIVEGVMYFSAFGRVVQDHVITQAGGCTSNLIDAAQIDTPAVIIPDCKNLIGCLFCKYYILHLDLNDAAKLISMEYLITQLEGIKNDPAEFALVYGPTLARIRWLLGVIEGFNDELGFDLPRLRQKIYREESLTSYWQAKLSILDEVGVI